ncbi:MAG: glycosyltransferase family 4 protein [Chloroflexi bacterium]|nr:glycosyltransferase family 4 protein [Chloroflexota bacterium]
MTILFNDNMISSTAQRGVARFFDRVVDGAIALLGDEAMICSPKQRDYGPARHIQTFRVKGSWRIGLQDKLATAVAFLTRPAVIYNVYYGDVRTSAPQVYTVYDMMHEMFAPPKHPFIAQKRRCLERAAAMLAISENTAQDMHRIYPHIDVSKVVVTPLGVDDFFFAGPDEPSTPAGKPYFLYVGHRTPYKNFMRLLTAYGQSGLCKQFDLHVISPKAKGFEGYTQEELGCIRQYRLKDSVHLMVSVPDTTLRDAYRGAAAFIYPSTYEGFGLPILEAMASGTLVATSNISSMPEIGIDIAFYFDPLSTESIATCLQRIAGLAREERTRRITAGLAHARTYTWERCQRQTMDVLRRLAH